MYWYHLRAGIDVSDVSEAISRHHLDRKWEPIEGLDNDVLCIY